jgi:hypothetical protein
MLLTTQIPLNREKQTKTLFSHRVGPKRKKKKNTVNQVLSQPTLKILTNFV